MVEKQKQNKLACVSCHDHKWKCDKMEPCNNCTKKCIECKERIQKKTKSRKPRKCRNTLKIDLPERTLVFTHPTMPIPNLHNNSVTTEKPKPKPITVNWEKEFIEMAKKVKELENIVKNSKKIKAYFFYKK